MNSTEKISWKVDEFVKERGHKAVVCFDFFDTLVTRKVMPEYTKKIASRQLSALFGQKISGHDFYKKRRSLEAEICAENLAKGNDQEFNLIDLSRSLYRYLLDRAIIDALDLDSAAFTEIFINVELTVEKQVQQSSAILIELLKKLKDEDVKILLISDFYIPSNIFSKLLQHHGLDGVFERVFISCDHLRTKGSGRLYDLILRELDLKANNLLMIGDNPHADKKMAEDNGLQALLVDSTDNQYFYQKWEVEQQKNTTLQKQLVDITRKDNLGVFQEYSLTIWHFIRKLFEALRIDGVQDVFFLSREGEFLKTLFVRYQKQFFGQEVIRSHYLLVSRKSSYVASLDSLESENFGKLFKQYSHIAPRDFLLSLNFTEYQSRQICTAVNIDYTTKIHDFAVSSEYRTIRNSSGFQKLYEQFRLEQRNNFTRYLMSFGVDFAQDRLTIVDVGWKGSMQENLFRILNKNIEIAGYYIGLLDGGMSSETSLMQKTGILFSDLSEAEQFFSVYNNNRALFEMMLGASHGSAEGYFLSQSEVNRRDNGSFYGKYDGVHVAVAEAAEESELFVSKIQPLQESICSTFSRIGDCFLNNYQSDPPEDWFAAQHARMVFLPTKTEVDFFESLYHLENFGVFEFTTFCAGEKLSLRKRVFNLKAVISDPPLLEIGFWPPVILRHLGIGWYRSIDGWKRFRRVFGFRRLWCALRFF
jgi:predicted HAD superfamily hydrolase